MDNIKNNKKLIIICIIVIIIFVLIGTFIKYRDSILALKYFKNVEDRKIERYEANEFIPIYMEEEDVVKKYINDYKNKMIYNLNEAYNMLNENYRNVRFGSIDNYKKYVDSIMSLTTYSLEVDKYSVSNINGSKIFNVYDKSGYQYIIKEKSIMDYEIYLDENTVAIR